jgi:lysophospholipase L1-like esterase
MPQPLSARRKVLFTLITFLVVLVAVELGLHAIDGLARRLARTPAKLPFHGRYQGQEWAAALARESDGRGQVYHQYLTWISKPQKGRFVNIDRDTGRRTWNPPHLKAPEVTVMVFGGSACWGYGARDDYTLPSQLSRRLNAREPHVRVYNYGEPGYTFTQGVAYLITKLQEGARPDFVICYDGFNDVYGAYQSGRPGTLHNVAQLREKLTSKPRQLCWQAAGDWLKENIYLYSKVFPLFFQGPQHRFREVGAGFDDHALQNLAAGTVQYYARTLALLDHLAQTYSFKYACFWQPALFAEAGVLPQETRVDARLEDKNFAKLYKFTSQYLAQPPPSPHFYNFTNVLSSRTQPYYIDLVHLTEEGYGVVAADMAKALRQDFALGDSGARPWTPPPGN